MMGFTADGHVDPKMASAREQVSINDSMKIKEKRAEIPTSEIAPGSDAWQQGQTYRSMTRYFPAIAGVGRRI
jgi:hypothetical protein